MDSKITNIEPVTLQDEQTKEETEAVVVTTQTLMTWPEFEEFKKKTKSWSYGENNIS